MNANRNLRSRGTDQQKAQEKLSSGLRINRSADDAAGLAISEGMRSQIRGLNQATRNSQDAISVIQTAEGALGEVHACLHRMRELSVQAANETYAPLDQNELQKEIEELKAEIDRISQTTHFNKKNLLDGTAAAIVSSDRDTTQVIMRGGIRDNGVSAAGTYRLDVSLASSGTTEVLLSSVFKTTSKGGFNGTAGVIASGGVKLRDIDRFYDNVGRFMIETPQSIVIMDGKGKQVQFTIYSDDTLSGVAKKFNDAIALSGTFGLGMGKVDGVSTANDAFAKYVTDTSVGGVESVSGTFVLRSSIAGTEGKFTIIAGVDVVQAFGFDIFQKAEENRFHINVYKGNTFLTSGTVQGNSALGMVHRNVDIQFDSTANTQVSLIDGKYVVGAGASFSTKISMADNTQVFQIGSNELQIMNAAVGLINCDSLGIRDLMINTSENAGRSITKLDIAIGRVSTQRSSLGAIQNRLEHTMNNLGVASENITASESRIRDVDMAMEMMEFTKLNVLTQSGIAMLAQANQKPQQVMQLLGGV